MNPSLSDIHQLLASLREAIREGVNTYNQALVSGINHDRLTLAEITEERRACLFLLQQCQNEIKTHSLVERMLLSLQREEVERDPVDD